MRSAAPVQFFKLSGAGNDFVAFDNRDGRLPMDAARDAWFRRLCARGEGVGADGVLVIEPAADADVRMRYHNADGGEAGMCGNGLRCLALLAHRLGAAGPEMTVRTMAGLHRAEILGPSQVRVTITDPTRVRAGVEIEENGMQTEVCTTHVHVGVPHLAIDVTDSEPGLDALDVETIGRRLRHHPAVMPEGANANFYRRLADGRLAMRTYERGVEAETLACGTGAVSCAVAAALVHGQRPPIDIVTRSGHTLRVDFRREGERITGVTLEGPAEITFTGTLGSALMPR